jgi:hypothetical protein
VLGSVSAPIFGLAAAARFLAGVFLAAAFFLAVVFAVAFFFATAFFAAGFFATFFFAVAFFFVVFVGGSLAGVPSVVPAAAVTLSAEVSAVRGAALLSAGAVFCFFFYLSFTFVFLVPISLLRLCAHAPAQPIEAVADHLQ